MIEARLSVCPASSFRYMPGSMDSCGGLATRAEASNCTPKPPTLTSIGPFSPAKVTVAGSASSRSCTRRIRAGMLGMAARTAGSCPSR
ncbi:hypothetical protein D3C80_1911690 [compost metagenome]